MDEALRMAGILGVERGLLGGSHGVVVPVNAGSGVNHARPLW
jgi:hypothetical protein